MITVRKAEYINFLEQNELLDLLIETVKPTAFEHKLSSLRSIEILQQLAEHMIEENMAPDVNQ